MSRYVPISQVTRFLLKFKRVRAPFGWWLVGQDVITFSAVCSFAPHLQAAVEAIPHLCVFKRNRSMSVWKRLSLTHSDLGELITGGVELTSIINEKCPPATSCFIYITPIVLLMPDWARLFSSSSAAGTNVCLD